MIRDFQSIEDRVRSRERQPLVAIAAPQGDAEILEAVAEAERLGIAAFRLIDDADEAAAAARAARRPWLADRGYRVIEIAAVDIEADVAAVLGRIVSAVRSAGADADAGSDSANE